jgi:glutamyl-tRNA reductase
VSAPLAIVGASWRTANTSTRAALASLAPIQSLREAGYVSGAACISTCSRTEWVLTSPQPEWAASLLRGAIASRLPELSRDAVQTRAGPGAIHYLLRVAAGLDSVAEGEGAVGRQVLNAFEEARRDRASDRLLNRVGRHVERLIHGRRLAIPAAQSRGVQALVREALRESAPLRVAILGRGEFGLAMERSLRAVPDWELTTWTRGTLDALVSALPSHDALVICTGGPAPWLSIPRHARGAICIDAGSPPQLQHAAEGWRVIGLDALLARPDLQLGEDERVRLESLVDTASAALLADLQAPAPSSTLAAIDAERAAFLNEQLPVLLESLPPKEARRVRRAVSAFTHRLILKTRVAS